MTRLLRLAMAALVAITALDALAPAAAQPAYPSRPIHLIVPTPPGGTSDAAARLLAQALSKSMGQPFTIENKPGASGAVAAQALMAAPADGHTLMWTLASMSGLASVLKSPPYRSLAELTPVSIVCHLEYAMFIHPDVPATTVAEFVAHARAHPDAISYATGSLGDYMAATKFFKTTGMRGVRVPYRGGSQLMPDLASGRVQLNFGPVSNGLPLAKDGKLRMLAVLQAQRSAVAPSVPTLAELGIAAVTLPTWQALFAPANTPADVVQRLAKEIALALAEPALRAQFAQLAVQADGSTPQRLAEVVARDTQAWRNFVDEYDIPQE